MKDILVKDILGHRKKLGRHCGIVIISTMNRRNELKRKRFIFFIHCPTD